EVPALPDKADGGGEFPVIELGGEAVKLDSLGPIVVNPDGTMRRITNWNKLTPEEQERTLQKIGKRNRVRQEDLVEKAEL
ncbi:hypothetical protein PBRA_004526, partial [Plasmodiophora brassicae]